MYHSVVFLVLSREFVLLYAAFGIIIGMGAQYQAVLRLPVHGLGIDIVAGLFVLNQPAFFLPQPEVLHGLGVCFPAVFVDHGFEIDFGSGDMQE